MHTSVLILKKVGFKGVYFSWTCFHDGNPAGIFLLILTCNSYIFEPRREKIGIREFPTRSDINQPV